jgi:hypothetical protein
MLLIIAYYQLKTTLGILDDSQFFNVLLSNSSTLATVKEKMMYSLYKNEYRILISVETSVRSELR